MKMLIPVIMIHYNEYFLHPNIPKYSLIEYVFETTIIGSYSWVPE